VEITTRPSASTLLLMTPPLLLALPTTTRSVETSIDTLNGSSRRGQIKPPPLPEVILVGAGRASESSPHAVTLARLTFFYNEK
jgi:hypothetical protein